MSENTKVSSKIKLLPHNQELYDKIVEQIEKGEKSIFYSQATGLGKSFIFMKLVEDYFQGKRIMYVVPKIAIWKNLIRYKEFETLDATIDMYTYQSFNTYDSSLVDKYDVVFIDECHHMLSDIQGTNIMTYCLDMNNVGKFTFGFTATPYYQGKYVDEECFDVSCYGYDVYEAIDKGILPKIKLALADINLDEVPWHLKVQYSITGTKSLLHKLTHEHTEIHRWIAYFRNRKELEARARELSKLFPDYKIVKTYIGYEYDDLVIDEFNNYEGNIILLSVNKLLEGIHLKNVQGVLLYRNVTEFSTYMQMYGRLCDINTKVTPLFLDVSNALLSFRSISETKSSRFKGNRKIYSKKDLFDINATDYWTVELYEALCNIDSYFWSKEDTTKLINNFDKVTSEELYDMFPNRSKAAIRQKLKQLGLSLQSNWTTEEDNKLIDNCELSYKQLKVLFPTRTVQAIKRRKSVLGLASTSSTPWTDEEFDTLKNAPNMTAEELYAALPNKTPLSILNMRKKLKIGAPKRIPEDAWPSELIDILVDNYPIMGYKCFEVIEGKTKAQCANKVFELGIKRQTEEDSNLIEYIKANYGKVSNNIIAALFGVNSGKVQRLACKLNLTKKKQESKELSNEDLLEIKDAYNKGGCPAVKAIPKFSGLSVSGIRCIANRLGCTSPNRKVPLSDKELCLIDSFIYTDPIIRPGKDIFHKAFENRTYRAVYAAIRRRIEYLGIKQEKSILVCSKCKQQVHNCVCDSRPAGLSIEFINSLYK